MRIIRAKEHGPIPLVVTEDTKIRRDVLKRGYAEVRTDNKNWGARDTSYGRVGRELHAGSVAGLLPLTEDTAVLVEPRFPANLTHMVNAVGHPDIALDIVRSYSPIMGAEAADWMLDHLSTDFVGAVEAVVQQGLFRNYLERRTSTTSPKGRILVGATLGLRASRGIDFKAEVAYHERTEENAPNQALVEGVHWVHVWTCHRPKMKSIWRRATALLHLLRYVPRDPDGWFKRDPLVRHPLDLPVAARSAYYRALPLATALLERRGFSLDAAEGDLAMSSLLVETDDVFEDFVRLRLSEYLPDPTLTVVDGNKMPKRLLYAPALPADVPPIATPLPLGNANIQPDILIEDGLFTLLVVDVKYKPVRGHADRNTVIEQLVTYAHRLNCSRAVSVHPAEKGQTSGLFVSGRIGTTTLYNYRVNLGVTDLEAEMRQMAEALGSLC